MKIYYKLKMRLFQNSFNFNIVNTIIHVVILNLMESNLELLSKMNCFINVLFIFTVLKLKLFLF